jgi:2,5-dihydroxypyridine 5,6-dioxygenase
MFADRIEAKWIVLFRDVLQGCGVTKDSLVGIVAETQSRELNVHLVELALGVIGARHFKLVATSPAVRTAVPTRSTGTSMALAGLEPILPALAPCDLVVDLTMEGCLHSPQLRAILGTGTRAVYILNEHPEGLERAWLSEADVEAVERNYEMLARAGRMTVVSDAGTDLRIDLTGQAPTRVTGVIERPGTMGHWPGGLVVTYPAAGCVNGRIVVDTGDINCTFKRYADRPMTLVIENDIIVDVLGDGVDAELFRTYSAAWNETNALTTAHFGWGMNPRARWEALAMYDKRDTNCIEARAFAGNFLVGIGASHVAKRDTQNHFDIPLRNTTVKIDDITVVDRGRVCFPAAGAA